MIIATFNRPDSVARLLSELAEQTLDPSRYEVIVVDDGSVPPAAPRLSGLEVPYRLEVLTQANAGPAAARHRALERARGELAVLVDDDMRVAPNFLAAHRAAHPSGTRRAALGPLRASSALDLPLFERCHIALLEKLEREVRNGETRLRGTNLYTGNVSFPRADYFAAGGFDLGFRISEDTELGVRMERAGIELVIAEDAIARHDSDHTSLATWMRRSRAYGAADARIAAKHPGLAWANPWRFLVLMHPMARPFLMACVLAPIAMKPASRAAMLMSMALAKLGAERVAVAGTTVVYGMQYFIGVRTHAGSLRRALRELRDYRALARATAPSAQGGSA
ncbi:MAG: glycosyltransferase [Gemmatimonadaceae bacterium]|nr:glycosyltransferase [Gemmatimonadaceae bacterium]